MDIVSGIIQKVNYYNEENGYTVAVIEVDSKHKNILVKKGKLYSNNLTVIFSIIWGLFLLFANFNNLWASFDGVICALE